MDNYLITKWEVEMYHGEPDTAFVTLEENEQGD
jgi:hypothetical protein